MRHLRRASVRSPTAQVGEVLKRMGMQNSKAGNIRGRWLLVALYFAFTLIFFLLLPPEALARELFDTHSNARAMGLGGAYAALVDDEESLFYNPAGIARNGGLFWTIADPKAGGSGNIMDAFDIYQDLQDASSFQAALDDLYGNPIWIGGSAKTSIIMPFFAAAYFYDVDASFLAENPISPTLTTNFITDTGVALGTGFSIGPFFQTGFVAKYITRTGDRKDFGAQTIADVVSGTLTPDDIFDSLTETKGTGYAFDMGMNITVPLPVQPTLSFVWKNIGDTKFRAGVDEPTPPKELQDMTVGASLLIDAWLVSLVPIVEVNHLQEGDVQIGQKLHMGLELGIPFVDFRVGLHQGYLSYGAGIDLGILRLDAASWGVELGGYPGQYESRRYMVQATLSLGFDFGWGSGAGSSSAAAASGGVSKSGAAGAGAGSSGSRGRGRFKKTKQRR
jgi:hypothetical protein